MSSNDVSQKLDDMLELIKLIEQVCRIPESRSTEELPLKGVVIILSQIKEMIRTYQLENVANTELLNESVVNVVNNSVNQNSSNNRTNVRGRSSLAERIQQSPASVSGVTRVRELLSNVGASVGKGGNYQNEDQNP